jgi:hypothetical protein
LSTVTASGDVGTRNEARLVYFVSKVDCVCVYVCVRVCPLVTREVRPETNISLNVSQESTSFFGVSSCAGLRVLEASPEAKVCGLALLFKKFIVLLSGR